MAPPGPLLPSTATLRSLLLVGALLAAPLVSSARAGAQEISADVEGESQMLARINAMRSASGLVALQREATLDAAARVHSEDMASNDFVDHVSPRTGDPAARMRTAGASVEESSQNVVFHTSAERAHEALVQSEAHRQNLMNPRFTHIGISVMRGARGVYVTQLVGRLAAEPNLPPPAPVATTPAAAPPVPAIPAPAPAPPSQATLPPAPPGAAAQGPQRVAGYWVSSNGRWYYYPLPANAQSGQVLTPTNATSTPPAHAAPPQGWTYPSPGYVPPVTQGSSGWQYAPQAPPRPVPAPAPPFGWSPRRNYQHWYWRGR